MNTRLDDREIPPLDRLAFWGFLGEHKVMEPDTEELMAEYNEAMWRAPDVARGTSWHTSFHASEFPGDDPEPCQRYLAYRMMDFPPRTPMPPWVTTTGDVGKAGELSIARAWYMAGRSLTIPDDMPGGGQLVFEHKDAWMSGSVDIPILKRGWRKPHIVEVKGKAHEVVEAMQKGERRWDEPHRRQLLASLGLAHEYDWGCAVICRETWRLAIEKDGKYACRAHGTDNCLVEIELEPPDSGSIYYWSRSWPRQISEYFFAYDGGEYMRRGLGVLEQVRDYVIRDQIPPRDENFMWSLGKCKNCAFKAEICKPDFGPRKKDEPTVVLTESNGVEWARAVRGIYDPEAARNTVMDRWADTNPFLAGSVYV